MDTTENTTHTTETRSENRLMPSGGYRRLLSFQLSTIIYDATVSFCERFIDHSSRTYDRMVQAARSARQNIAKSNRTGTAKSKTATHWINAARNSLDELLLDYEDFLRQHKLHAWARDDSEAQTIHNVALEHKSAKPLDTLSYAAWLEHKEPAVAANASICLILQADVLLVRQAAAQEHSCISPGSEQLTSARIAARQVVKHQTDSSDTQDPVCGLCGKPMALRTARKGRNEGRSFWGCTGYPGCKGTMPGKNYA